MLRVASRSPMSALRGRARSYSTCSLFRSTPLTSCFAAAIIGCARRCRRPRAPNASAASSPSGPASPTFAPDLVANMQRENWVQRRRISASDAIPLPTGLDPLQAAMLRINPATALLLLEDHVTLKPGDWVIQNVANSAVGRHLIVLAKEKGARTLNVVRRDDVAPELKALGADVVLNDGPDLPARARDAAQGAPIRLGIDAVSGEACKRIADSVADGGVVVTYGSMSGADPVISRLALGRGITLKSFMLGDGLAKRSLAQVRAIYADLAGKLRDGKLNAPIDATYPIEEIRAALAHAQRGGRQGKVLVLPNGPV